MDLFCDKNERTISRMQFDYEAASLKLIMYFQFNLVEVTHCGFETKNTILKFKIPYYKMLN